MLNNPFNYMLQLLSKDIKFSQTRAKARRRIVRHKSYLATQNGANKKCANSCAAFNLEGLLTTGKSTEFAVAGEDIVIDAATWILGDISVGSNVSISGYIRNGSEMYAKKVIVGN